MYTAHHLSAIATFTGGATGKDALFLYMPFQNTHRYDESVVRSCSADKVSYQSTWSPGLRFSCSLRGCAVAIIVSKCPD